MTHHERIDAKTGAVTFSAALHDTKVDGKDSRHLRVMMPLEMRLSEGVRVSVFPKDVWAKVAKNEKLKKEDEARVKALKLTYTHCHAMGCVAEVEATPEILASLKSGGGLRALTLNLAGGPITLDVPLAGFDQALAGPAVETKEFAKARTALMKQIEEHQRRMPLYERPTRCGLVVDNGGPCNPRLLLKGWRP
jgi:invasion protein IalB